MADEKPRYLGKLEARRRDGSVPAEPRTLIYCSTECYKEHFAPGFWDFWAFDVVPEGRKCDNCGKPLTREVTDGAIA